MIDNEVLFHKLVSAIFLPPLSFILLLLGGFWLYHRRPVTARLLLFSTLGAMYLLSIPKVALWLHVTLDNFPVAPLDAVRQVDAIVVLGAGQNLTPERERYALTAAGYIRLRYAASLARHTDKPILISGGAPYGGEPEAKTMARTLKDDFGIRARWLEESSNTTWENATMSAPILKAAGIHYIALVSHAWHLTRAIPLFQQYGFTVLPAPTGFLRDGKEDITKYIPSATALQESTIILKEWLGIVFYRYQKWVRSL